jgi:putative exporter of polyketide antibiotics
VHIESWMVIVVVVLLIALVLGLVGLLPRVCQLLCQRLEKCRAPGDWPCQS